MSKTFQQNFSAKPARKSLGWELRPENFPMHEPGEWEQNFCSTPQREVSNNRVPPFYPRAVPFCFLPSVWFHYSRCRIQCQQPFYKILYIFWLQVYTFYLSTVRKRCVNRGGLEPQAHTLGLFFLKRFTHFAPVYTWLTHLCVNRRMNIYASERTILRYFLLVLCTFDCIKTHGLQVYTFFLIKTIEK